jgi:hypothetical protein
MMTFQREEAVTAREPFARPGEVGTVHCVEPGDKCPTSRHLLSTDQEQHGEAILTALSDAVRSRQRDLMREALRKAGCFLLSTREALAHGEHEPLVVTRVACRLRWIELAPTFAWL